MRKKNLILIIIFIFALLGSFTNAQIQDTDIILSISPEYPNPNQNVTATLSSHSIDLNKVNVSWSVDSQERSIGIGKKTFYFETGKSGIPSTLTATIETIDGQNILKTMTIVPADVDILWEAYDSYTPPFYKGKALAPSQGKFKIVAIPNLMSQSGKTNSNNLSYTWKKDGTTQSSSSGWGKNYLIFTNSYLDKDNTVEVKVSDISGGTNASSKITLKTTTPKILFYRNDSVFGTQWESVLNDGFTVGPNGETLVVEPYFFSPKNLDSDYLNFSWSLNSQKIQTPDPKNILSVKPENGQSGNTIIKIAINNTKTLFQSLEKKLTVQF